MNLLLMNLTKRNFKRKSNMLKTICGFKKNTIAISDNDGDMRSLTIETYSESSGTKIIINDISKKELKELSEMFLLASK